jgi:hypothetical protein
MGWGARVGPVATGVRGVQSTAGMGEGESEICMSLPVPISRVLSSVKVFYEEAPVRLVPAMRLTPCGVEGLPIGIKRSRFRGVSWRWISVAGAALSFGAVVPRAFAASANATTGVPRVAEAGRVTAAYVGDQACYTCHQEKSDSYRQTAHALTSRPGSAQSIAGKFDVGANVLRTRNPDLLFMLEARTTGHFQKGVIRTPSQILERAERIDIVIGSGRKGQSYLFWDGDALCQLPVSYWTEMDEWVNSPGYIDGKADFERPIAPRCLECHTSSFEVRALPNFYAKSSLQLGISCEKCHGPAGEHVQRYTSNSPPARVAASAIVNPAKLPRSRQMDVCALCHAGIGHSRAPALSFVPGKALNQYLETPKPKRSAQVDVHGSQVQLLEQSRCFQSSPSLSCATCHDVHTPERDVSSFVSDCLKCHQVEKCGAFPRLAHAIDEQCITCHMPLQETEQIIISGKDGRSLQPKVRNHKIGIYPEIELP